MINNAHTLKPEEVFVVVKSSPGGISSQEAGSRIKEHGKNVLLEDRNSS